MRCLFFSQHRICEHFRNFNLDFLPMPLALLRNLPSSQMFLVVVLCLSLETDCSFLEFLLDVPQPQRDKTSQQRNQALPQENKSLKNSLFEYFNFFLFVFLLVLFKVVIQLVHICTAILQLKTLSTYIIFSLLINFLIYVCKSLLLLMYSLCDLTNTVVTTTVNKTKNSSIALKTPSCCPFVVKISSYP